MNEHHDTVILLNGIKSILYGIAWLLLGSFLLLSGLIVSILLNGLIGFLMMFIGVFPLLAGILYICWGHNHYTVAPSENP